MNTPTDRTYTKTHEWLLEIDDGLVEVGLTDYAQNEMGDLVFIDLPEEGDEVVAGQSFADAESVKAVSEIFSPITGTVAAINEELLDNAALVNEDPYGAWFVRIEPKGDSVELLDAAAYEEFCA